MLTVPFACGALAPTPTSGGREILGVGIDVVDLGDVEHDIRRYGRRRLGLVHTAGELERAAAAGTRTSYYAVLFALKEALTKALDPADHPWPWTAIDVDPAGTITLTGGPEARAAEVRLRGVLGGVAVHPAPGGRGYVLATCVALGDRASPLGGDDEPGIAGPPGLRALKTSGEIQ